MKKRFFEFVLYQPRYLHTCRSQLQSSRRHRQSKTFRARQISCRSLQSSRLCSWSPSCSDRVPTSSMFSTLRRQILKGSIFILQHLLNWVGTTNFYLDCLVAIYHCTRVITVILYLPHYQIVIFSHLGWYGLRVDQRDKPVSFSSFLASLLQSLPYSPQISTCGWAIYKICKN